MSDDPTHLAQIERVLETLRKAGVPSNDADGIWSKRQLKVVFENTASLDRARRRGDQPPAASTPEVVSSVGQPPPLPPATPDATQAHQRQTAAEANASREVFVEAPAAIEGWWQLASHCPSVCLGLLKYEKTATPAMIGRACIRTSTGRT